MKILHQPGAKRKHRPALRQIPRSLAVPTILSRQRVQFPSTAGWLRLKSITPVAARSGRLHRPARAVRRAPGP